MRDFDSTDASFARIPPLLGFRLPLRFNRQNIIWRALGLVLVVVTLDATLTYAIAAELRFTILYLVPVALAVWFHGRVFGLIVSVIAACSSLAVAVLTHVHNGVTLRPFVLAWNYGGSLLLYVGLTALLSRLRVFADREAAARRATVEQLRQAERLGVIGQLAAGVAHELGTPLGVVIGHAEMIAQEARSLDDARSSCTVIISQAEKMAAIVRGLLGFSRRGARGRDDVDMAQLTSDAATLVRTIARKHNVDVGVEIERAALPLVVEGNRTELEQVLVNLMMNGVQAMPRGGLLKVSARSERRRGDARPAVVVDVEDQGVGIPPEHLQRIFDPFFTTKEPGAGTGLGLAVSYGIVSDHDGRIMVDSRLGLGSRFSLRLPTSPHASEARA